MQDNIRLHQTTQFHSNNYYMKKKKIHPCFIQVLTEDRIEILDSGRILRLENITINDRGVLSCKLNLKSFPVHVNHTLEILG